MNGKTARCEDVVINNLHTIIFSSFAQTGLIYSDDQSE